MEDFTLTHSAPIPMLKPPNARMYCPSTDTCVIILIPAVVWWIGASKNISLIHHTCTD